MLPSKQCYPIQLSLIVSSKWTAETEKRPLHSNEINLPSLFPNLVIAVFCSFMSSWRSSVYVVQRIKVFNSAITSRVRDDSVAGRGQWGDRAAVGGRVNRKMIERCMGEKANLWWGGDFLDWAKEQKLWRSEIQQREKKKRVPGVEQLLIMYQGASATHAPHLETQTTVHLINQNTREAPTLWAAAAQQPGSVKSATHLSLCNHTQPRHTTAHHYRGKKWQMWKRKLIVY